MFELGGYLFSISEVLGAFVTLQTLGLAGTIAILIATLKKGKTPMSVVSDNLNAAVVSLDTAVNEMVASVDAFSAAVAANDDEEVQKALERINAITDAVRAATGRMKSV